MDDQPIIPRPARFAHTRKPENVVVPTLGGTPIKYKNRVATHSQLRLPGLLDQFASRHRIIETVSWPLFVSRGGTPSYI